MEIYREACRVQRDKRLSDEGRTRKVFVLEAEIVELCEGMWLADLPPMKGLENDYRLLVDELMRIMLREELFTFVTAKPTTQPNGMTKPVDGTNNEAEQQLCMARPRPCDGPDEQDRRWPAAAKRFSPASWNRYVSSCRPSRFQACWRS